MWISLSVILFSSQNIVNSLLSTGSYKVLWDSCINLILDPSLLQPLRVGVWQAQGYFSGGRDMGATSFGWQAQYRDSPRLGISLEIWLAGLLRARGPKSHRKVIDLTAPFLTSWWKGCPPPQTLCRYKPSTSSQLIFCYCSSCIPSFSSLFQKHLFSITVCPSVFRTGDWVSPHQKLLLYWESDHKF